MLDEFVDELTKSITEVATGRSYPTLVSPVTVGELNAAATNWRFDWFQELTTGEVFKLTAPKLGRLIHGLISLTCGSSFVVVNLVESHPENIGRGKKYNGVAANLIAFACQLAFEKGYEGAVSFDAKSELIAHYERTLGAKQVGRSQRMVMDRAASLRLVEQYFGGKHGKN